MRGALLAVFRGSFPGARSMAWPSCPPAFTLTLFPCFHVAAPEFCPPSKVLLADTSRFARLDFSLVVPCVVT